jgi:hypothetical protein
MTWKFWQRASSVSSRFEEDVIFRLVSLARRLGQIESDVRMIRQDIAQIKDDSSYTRAAVVEINGTVNGHLHSHEQDSARPNGEAKREHLRRVPTLSEEQ